MTSPSDITTTVQDQAWVPSSCTLPTVDQPVRVAEFDDLFASSVRAVESVSPTTTRLLVDAGAADRARELAGRESDCCSFFDLTSTDHPDEGLAVMVATVPPAHAAVLDAWIARAATVAGVDRS